MTLAKQQSAVSRVLKIVEVVTQSDTPLSPADIACHLNLPKSSVHRLLKQLGNEQYLSVDKRGLIIPGNRIHSIAAGILYYGRYNILHRTILSRLAKETGECCGIAIPNGTGMVYYESATADKQLQLHLLPGTAFPIWCTSSGKLYLSLLTSEQRQCIYKKLIFKRYARNTILEPEKLEDSLLQIQTSGIGTDNEEFIDGTVACAVPIKDETGTIIASLFSHAPVFRKRLDALLDYTPLLLEAADDLGPVITKGI